VLKVEAAVGMTEEAGKIFWLLFLLAPADSWQALYIISKELKGLTDYGKD
jgi:hypothetical protein